ncbi:hypothetical protein [Saccharopolyspora dendranthemae]|uniref:Uncharacterized protein n=1 Tax=Saccharopolyspora dendranthemae TaxID=1181886 RepID=A0A561U902_9PSEU|nr:hypothetical protein [Saccharopolyspora dendranthemae]TWF95839.1 hypothetical protein FHU35_12839 [Saccharopolyspora dendranthemae]
MATVWVALAAEAIVLMGAAGALASWARRSNDAPDPIIEPAGQVA